MEYEKSLINKLTELLRGMTKGEAIKYLQQLYPNGGHCWLDEQRIEAISMAINALQEEPVSEQNLSNVERTVKNWKEPLSEDLGEASKNYALNNTPWDDCVNEMQESFKAGAKWQKEKEEPINEDLGLYINELSKQFPEVSFAKLSRIAVRVAKWQKSHLWKPADGDDLPKYDRDVIVLTQPYPLEGNEYVVSFAHRPNPNGWDGKSFTTGKVEHYTPMTYGEGGWNIPYVNYWLDCLMPKEIEL